MKKIPNEQQAQQEQQGKFVDCTVTINNKDGHFDIEARSNRDAKISNHDVILTMIFALLRTIKDSIKKGRDDVALEDLFTLMRDVYKTLD